MRPRYSCLSLKLIFLKTEMKKIVLKKKRRTSFFEGKSRGELINTWDPIGPSITINVICEAERKKKRGDRGRPQAFPFRSFVVISDDHSSPQRKTRDAQRVTCKDENKLFFQSGSPRDNVAASCALGCSGSCSVDGLFLDV